MNRRALLALGAGLVVGEPARRAYSFLNWRGLSEQDHARRFLAVLARTELETAKWVHGPAIFYPAITPGTRRLLVS